MNSSPSFWGVFVTKFQSEKCDFRHLQTSNDFLPRKWPKYPRFWGGGKSISPDWWMDHFFQNFDIYCKAKGSQKKKPFLDDPHFDYTNLVKRSQLGRVPYNCVTNYANCFFSMILHWEKHTHTLLPLTSSSLSNIWQFLWKYIFSTKGVEQSNFEYSKISATKNKYTKCTTFLQYTLVIGKNKTEKKLSWPHLHSMVVSVRKR